MADVAVLVRNQFIPLPDARVRSLGANAFELSFTVTAPIKKRMRPTRLEDWDGAIFAIGEDESQPAMGTALDGDTVTVTVLML